MHIFIKYEITVEECWIKTIKNLGSDTENYLFWHKET